MDMHRADPAYRRRSLRALGLALAVIAVALIALQRWLADVIAALPQMAPDLRRDWLRGLFTALFAGLATPLAFASRSFHRFARSVQDEDRLPPARWRTWRDVRVLRGPVAQTWARRAHRLATLSALVAGALGGCAVAAWLRYA